jgi:hypothetical protein
LSSAILIRTVGSREKPLNPLPIFSLSKEKHFSAKRLDHAWIKKERLTFYAKEDEHQFDNSLNGNEVIS